MKSHSTIDIMSEITKLVRILLSHGNFGELQDELVKEANQVIGEVEKFCVQFKKDCIFFDEMSTKFNVEKMELQDELFVVKIERDDFREKVTRSKEDERKAREWGKMLEETLAKDLEEQTRIAQEKDEMILELNVKVTNLNNQVLEKDEMLNDFRERLKNQVLEREDLMVELARLKEDERIASERATMVEEKLAKDIEEQTQMSKEMISKLNGQVLEKDGMLNVFRERLKCMEVNTIQNEQEIHDLKKELSRSKEDERKGSKWAKNLEETLAKDCEEQTQMTNEKSEMISELNVKVTTLNNQVLEKNVMLNALRERLKSMEVGLAQKDQEVNDLKQKDAAAYKIMEEKLKSQVLLECNQMLNAWKEKMRLLEVKVLQKEQDVHDFKQQEIVAYQINEENLKKQVSERDQTLSKCDERLRFLEAKELQKEQEINDLNLQNAAAYKVVEERLNNHVLESDQLLNMCKGRLECMEAKVLQLEQELNDLKHQKLASFQSSEEKLKLMEVKVAQKEQEVHDLECWKSEAYKVMEEKLKKHVLQNDKMLKEFDENLKLVEMKVVQREQEVDDLKCQILASFQISKEKLKIMELKVVQKEQEVHDLNHQKLADYQTIRKLTHKQTEAYQGEEVLRRQNSEASENVENLKQQLLAVERDKLKSDDELKDIKEKQLEADNHLKKLRRENLVALRAVDEIKEWTLAADETFEANKERSEGLPRIKTVEEGLFKAWKIKVLEVANSVLKESTERVPQFLKVAKNRFACGHGERRAVEMEMIALVKLVHNIIALLKLQLVVLLTRKWGPGN